MIMIITNPPVCVAVHLIVGLNGSNHVSQEVHLVVVENLAMITPVNRESGAIKKV